MIIFDKVSKVYPNGVKGLDNVSLKIEQGEFVGIIVFPELENLLLSVP